jgi:hypothetical protein
MTISGAYLIQTGGGERDWFDYVPERRDRVRSHTPVTLRGENQRHSTALGYTENVN